MTPGLISPEEATVRGVDFNPGPGPGTENDVSVIGNVTFHQN